MGRLLCVAPAGSGKSVFTRALVCFAQEQSLMPIWVTCAELAKLAESSASPDELLQVLVQRTFLQECESPLEDGRMLLIIDGFGEAGAQRPMIMAWLRKFLECHPDMIFILTTRPSAIEDQAMSSGTLNAGSANFLEAKVLDWEDGQDDQLLLSKNLPVGTLVNVEFK